MNGNACPIMDINRIDILLLKINPFISKDK